ncbi:MAG: hypothetical protein R2698_10985 [Microthrixaceae bacterium]
MNNLHVLGAVASDSHDTVTVIRLFLHVLGASVWVGGQIVMMGLVPTLRKIDADLPRKAAAAFNLVAWPGFGVTVLTGVWNMLARSNLDQTLLGVKLLIVLLSGAGAFIHIVGKSKVALAIGGTMSGLFAIVAMYMGLLLH